MKDVGRDLPGPETVTNFLSRLGAAEMEIAAERIVEVCRKAGHWNAQFGMSDMDVPGPTDGSFAAIRAKNQTEQGQRGLFMLALHGWLVPGYPNGGATVTRALVKRLTESRQK